MKWTQFFIPTTKETPHEATVPSHILMIRAGMIRQVAAGSYTYLPLGYRSLQKVTDIIREEMNAAGAIELNMPAMHPIELWQESGRDVAMGTALVRLQDKAFRKDTVLGPTHEEVITDIARAYVHSYKQLPVNLYQIQTKFRDEPRPKSGVLRTREFLMKDAYSFDTDVAGLDASYEKMYRAYCRVFSRCGLPYRAAEAESGPIGGDASHEFMVVTDAGEDYMVRCQSCEYVANVERASFAPPQPVDPAPPPLEYREIHTPNLRTIPEVCNALGRHPSSMIKTLIYTNVVPHPRPEIGFVRYYMVLVRGDHDVNESKLQRVIGEPVELAPDTGVQHVTGARLGFAGPQGIQKKLDGVQVKKLVVDQAVSVMHDAASGANRDDYHVVGLRPGMHFPLQGENVVIAEVRSVANDDLCPHCNSKLIFEKCIEVGHVFKLGTKYSDSMNAHYLDPNGKSVPFIMGCYGMGLNRIVAAAIEAFHDDNGIIWPVSIAPFTVHICALDNRDENVMNEAGRIHDELEAEGIDVLLDDRNERPGVKFKDADLIGNPIRITVGKRGLADGIVELALRRGDDVQKIAPDQVTAAVKDVLAELAPKVD